MDRGRGRGRDGGRGRDFGGQGRGDFGGRGRGDFGGRGRGDFGGGRGRGDRGGRGDFGGGRGGGRDGGRGSGRDFGGARIAPNRDAKEGTAARPGRCMQLKTAEEAAVTMEQVVSSFDSDIQAVGVLPRPKRKGYGQKGRPVTIRANHFKVQCKLGQAVHYDVTVEGVRKDRNPEEQVPEPQGRRVAKPLPPEIFRDVMKTLAEQERWQAGWVYDGKKNLYSPNNFLPQYETSHEVAISDGGSTRQQHFKVTIKWAANINISDLLLFIKGTLGAEVPQEAIQALDVALKHNTSMNPLCHTVSRAFFFPEPSTTASLTGGAEVWLGYQQSLRPCETGLTLNVDIAATAFLEEAPTVTFLIKNAGVAGVAQLSNLTPVQLRKVQKAISGLKVEATHMGTMKRKYKVKALTKEGANELTFFNEEKNVEQTVQEYFEARYKLKLQFPGIPCLNVGSPKKPIYLPAEVSKIAKGQRRLKLDERQTAEMIKTAAKRPQERAAAIMNSVNQQGKLPTDATIQAFGMKIDPQMVTLGARVLDPPALEYAVPFRTPKTGDWNLRNVQFHTGARLVSFGVASFSPPNRVGRPGDPASVQAFVSELLQQLIKCGLREVPNPSNLPEVIFHNPNSNFPGETLKAAADAGSQHFGVEARIIFVLLPDSGADLYKEVKRASDSFIGIPSQCFVARKASIGMPMNKPRDQYTANLALKINTKLDGTNVIIKGITPWQSKPYMVIGADVTHPMGYTEAEPSIAAVVASLDANCTRFSADVKLQGHRIEIIQDLKATVRKLLLNFYRATGKLKPMKIIMYRDGVSEGQFNEVQRTEIPSIIAACRELGREAGEDYAPPLTFVVVQKRHHTRFFPMDNNADRSGNCMPGTVLDRGIVHPTEYSFFLQSHAGIQGTSRPAHYHVLLDQNNLGPDDLQAFTYNMCYTFCRCTRSVSVCPPAYYAHLAAFRGRCMMSHFDPSSDSESMASFHSGPKMGTHAEFAPIHAKLATRMFYV